MRTGIKEKNLVYYNLGRSYFGVFYDNRKHCNGNGCGCGETVLLSTVSKVKNELSVSSFHLCLSVCVRVCVCMRYEREYDDECEFEFTVHPFVLLYPSKKAHVC